MSLSSMQTLEARRRSLLARCEEQRLELAYHVAQLSPSLQLIGGWSRKKEALSAATRPLAWVAGVVGLSLVLLRKRRLITSVTWVTGLLALASRLTVVLRIVSQVRALYAVVKETRAAHSPQER